MNSYIVNAEVLEISSGQIKLSAKQYATRRHALKETDKAGIYDVTGTVQFKRGETVGIPGELPKSLAVLVEPAEKRAKAPSPPPGDPGRGGGRGAQRPATPPAPPPGDPGKGAGDGANGKG